MINFYKKINCDCLLMCGKVNRGLVVNNKLYGQLIDTIGDELSNENINVFSIGSEHEKFDIQDDFYGNQINLKYFLFTRLLIYKVKKVLSFLKLTTLKIEFLEYFYDNLFIKIKPKFIIGILPSPNLCISAKKNRITVYDLQHGVIGDFENEYYTIAYRRKYNQKGWPNYILTWNSSTEEWVSKNLYEYTSAINIGNPLLIKFNNNQLYDSYIRSNKSYFQKYFFCDKIKILLTLGYGLKKYGADSDYGLTKELIYIIKNYPDFNWFIRLHPVTLIKSNLNLIQILESEFNKCKNRVEWELTSILPLPVILKNTNIHISTISATCLEAAQYGIKTGMLAPLEVIYKFYNSEIDNKLVIPLVNNSEQIIKFITTQNIQNSNSNIDDTNYFNFINKLKISVNDNF